MKNYFIFFVFFIFIFSCSSEKKETVDANSLIKPKFQFNDYLFECNIKENSNLILFNSAYDACEGATAIIIGT